MSCLGRARLIPALAVALCVPLAGCGARTSSQGSSPPAKEKDSDKPAEGDKAPSDKPPDGSKAPQASKITKENFDKIQVGMTRKEVEAILGRGSLQREPLPPGVNSEKFQWRDGKKLIQIVFVDGKVQLTHQNGL
jgi:hypothetical protein